MSSNIAPTPMAATRRTLQIGVWTIKMKRNLDVGWPVDRIGEQSRANRRNAKRNNRCRHQCRIFLLSVCWDSIYRWKVIGWRRTGSWATIDARWRQSIGSATFQPQDILLKKAINEIGFELLFLESKKSVTNNNNKLEKQKTDTNQASSARVVTWRAHVSASHSPINAVIPLTALSS